MSRPQRLPREELRQSILEAAREILRLEGVEGLSARAIARRVGYTAASIYNVFDSMSDLLMEVNRDTLARIGSLFAQLPATGTPRDRLHRLCGEYIRFMQDNPALFGALFGGTRQREAFPDWYVQAIRELLGQVGGLLREHAPALDESQAMERAEQLYVAIHGTLALDLGRRLDLVTGQSAQGIAGAMLDAVLARYPS